MKTKVIQTIWTAESYDIFETICATPHFDDLIDILYDEGYLQGSTFTTERKTLKELYELAKYYKKKIVCTSDMYLPSDVIYNILKKNDYIIDKLYLSSSILIRFLIWFVLKFEYLPYSFGIFLIL